MSGLSQALSDFVQILVGGITELAQGIAAGIVAMAKALFLDITPASGSTPEVVNGLSVFGGIVAIFAGLALAVGITTRVYTWVTSLGN